MSDFVIVLTTLPLDVDPAPIADALIGERLAACVNVLPPMQSTYRWQGTVEHDNERQIVIKTSRLRVDALWQRLRDLHPYDVPEFVVIPIADGNQAYLNWIGETTT
jgi:periplasmic divalent cation tolerance protein